MPNASNTDLRGFDRHLQQGLARTQQSPVDHPDANLLVAFAEHSLSKKERAQVLDHLAVCSFCREVVALSAPETEEAATVAVVQPGWKWAFVSRWSWIPLTAGSLALLAVIGISVQRLSKESAQTAKVYEPQTQSQAQPGTEAKSAAQADSAVTASQTVVAPQQEESAANKGLASGTKSGSAASVRVPAVASLRSGVVGGSIPVEIQKKSEKEQLHGTLTANSERRDNEAIQSWLLDSNSTSSIGRQQAQSQPLPAASALAEKTADSADLETSTNGALQQANISRLPQEKDKTQIQAKQVHTIGPETDRFETTFNPDGTLRSAKVANKRQEVLSHSRATSTTEIAAAAPPQERPTPEMAFATGTPLWNAQSETGGNSPVNALGEEGVRTSQANRSVSQPVHLPENEAPLKVAQIGTMFFFVSRNGTLRTSSDNGTTWKDVSGPWKGPLKNVYTIGALLHVETAANETWTSSDQGSTWMQVKTKQSN